MRRDHFGFAEVGQDTLLPANADGLPTMVVDRPSEQLK